MIDIHSHILPGVDDGAPDLGVALSMLEASGFDGVKTQVLTPHMHRGRYDNKIENLQRIFEAFSVEVDKAGIAIELRLAAEIHISPEIPLLAKADEILWIGNWGGAKVFLLEFPFNLIPHGSLNLIQWLVKHNIKPLLVHPERYQAFQSSPDKLSEYLAAGCLIQITTSSITGQFNQRCYLAAEYFLKNEMVHFIASDCHNLDRRSPGLSEGVQCAAEIIGESQARTLVEENPARLLSAGG